MIALSTAAPLDVDALELRAAAHSGDHTKVVVLYRGPFLDGVHVSDASEGEDWISQERRSIERLFVTACAFECPRLAAANAWDACAALAKRWLTSEPTDPAAFAWRLRALSAPDTTAALRDAVAEYQFHSTMLAEEFGETAPPEAHALSLELADRLARSREVAVMEPEVLTTRPTDEIVVTPQSDLQPSSVPRREPVRVSRRFARIRARSTASGATCQRVGTPGQSQRRGPFVRMATCVARRRPIPERIA